MTPAEPINPPLSEAERTAMRAYLQRAEVRLSTMHRVAVGFISGAGLLLLIPIFFKDVVDRLIEVLLSNITNLYPQVEPLLGIALTVLLFVLVIYPLILSLLIPLYALYMLVKDIVHFYFTIYAPGYSSDLLTPAFSLTPLLFAPDESPTAKQRAMDYEYTPEAVGYTIPFSAVRRVRYFDDLMVHTGETLLPATRLAGLPEVNGTTEDDIRHFNAALGLTRSLDRTLSQEVAFTEMTMVRNVLYLRRLVLRYIKALLMFIWTTAVSFIMLPFVQHERFPALLMLALGYLGWSLTVLPVMRLPVYWMHRHRGGRYHPEQIDLQMRYMEGNVLGFVHLSVLASLLAVGLALFAR